MSISSSAVLVELSISVWTANKLDRAATDNTNNNAGAIRNAAQVKKNLMAGTDKRKKIADFASSCRVWHNHKTLPWADRGCRLMPTSLFFDYKQEANARRASFNQMVDEFVQAYPALVQTSQNYLGTLFDQSDYPDASEVATKFGFSLIFSPVPESGDFRLDIPAEDMEDVRKEYDRDFNKRLEDAMREPWDRLHTLLTGMSEKLTENTGDKVKRFHDTFVTNATDLCAVLSHLNVTRDPELERARQALENAISGVDIETVKESPEFRASLKADVDNIVKQFEW